MEQMYVMPEGYVESLDSKRLKFDLDIFSEFLLSSLSKHDDTGSTLASKASYVFDTRGFRFDKLKSIAEQQREIFFQKQSKVL